MIRAALAFLLLVAAFTFGLTDEWRLVNLCCLVAAILAAWSAIRPSYRPAFATVMRRLA